MVPAPPLGERVDKSLSADTVSKGLALDVLSRELLAEFMEKFNLPGEMEHTVGTMCSGSEVTHCAMRAIEKCHKRHGIGHTFKTAVNMFCDLFLVLC